ncbi:hypothetical protein HDU93_007740 [Gonapodya sp. JEL0774]|nr:hypothetical protein HDU93_007740 [Gonapodya sp. JEL0774]
MTRIGSSHELSSTEDTVDEAQAFLLPENVDFHSTVHSAYSDLPGGADDVLVTANDNEDDGLVQRRDSEEGPLIQGTTDRKRVRRRLGGTTDAGLDDEVLIQRDLEHMSVQSQVSARAVIAGLAIGTSLVFSNMYFGLQTGWVTMASLPSALLGYIILHRFSLWSPQENVLVQTVAVATGTMVVSLTVSLKEPLAGGFVGVVIALTQVEPEEGGPVQMTPGAMIAWTSSLAFFGVFFAVGMRSMTILREKLRFPSGTATAVLIKLLHSTISEEPATSAITPISEGPNVVGPSRSPLLYSFVASSSYTIASYFVPVLYNAPVMSWIGISMATKWGWWVTPSLSYVGQGMIMGAHTTISMLFGALFGWGFLGPYAESQGWCKGVFDWKEGAQGFMDPMGIAFLNARRVSHLLQSLCIVDLAYGGLALSTVLCAAILGPMFGVSWWKVGVAVIVGCLCAVVAVRTLGEIDVNPVSGIGKVSQLVFAAIAPGNIVANLVAGAIAEAGAQQAGDLLQDLKTGHLLSASPYAQFIGQLIGSVASVPLTVCAFLLYTKVYQVPGPELGAPTAAIWLDMARIVNGGKLPESVVPWCIIGGVFGAFLPILELLLSVPLSTTRGQSGDSFWDRALSILEKLDWNSWRIFFARLLPSGVGFAIGMYITPNFVLPRVAGGIVAYLWRTKRPKSWRGGDGIVVASGLVLGEGVTSLLVAAMKALGVKVLTCIGCVDGIRDSHLAIDRVAADLKSLRSEAATRDEVIKLRGELVKSGDSAQTSILELRAQLWDLQQDIGLLKAKK